VNLGFFSVIWPLTNSRYTFEKHIIPRHMIYFLSHGHKTTYLASAYVSSQGYQNHRYDINDGQEECVAIPLDVFNDPDQSAVESDILLP
jgi:hypothetical protein